MEDIKWFIKKFGIIFVILLVMIVSVGIFFEKNVRKSSAEETWEKPVQISDIEFWQEESDYERENEDNSPYWIIPQSKSLLSEEESKNIQNEALTAAELVKVVYKDIVIIDDVPAYASGIDGFTNEQGEQVIKILGKSGYVCVKENIEMQNYDKLQNFYKSYLIGQDTLITVFVVQADGLLGAQTFVYRNEKLQSYYVGIRWREGGEPEILGTSVSDLSEIKFTEKGYFIYTFENPVAHAGLREYWRVKLLPEKCRELTEKYIAGLSYVNYNMLVVNWDSSNVEDILMPCMFEDIYRIYTGKNLKTDNGEIPAEEYEKIMTTYFPVSTEQLRKYCKYNEKSNSYEYDMISASPYPPFGEVVDYTENSDGTITLIVDGVWADYNSDCAFTNRIVVQPFEDGTFRYLANSIEQKELELPAIARMNP